MSRNHAFLFVSLILLKVGRSILLDVEVGQNLPGKIYYECSVNHQIAFILSVDSPSGTGDHENYFHRRERVLEVDGIKVFAKCKKIAAVVRERYTHIQWFASDFTFLFSNDTKFYSTEKNADAVDSYTRALSPEFG